MGRKICHLLLFLMLILPLSYVEQQKTRHRQPALNTPPGLDPLHFCHTSKASPNNFDAVYNNKEYALFSSQRLLRSHLIRPKEAVEPAKTGSRSLQDSSGCGRFTLAKLADPCRRESRNTAGISDSLRRRPAPSQSTPTTPDTTRSNTK